MMHFARGVANCIIFFPSMTGLGILQVFIRLKPRRRRKSPAPWCLFFSLPLLASSIGAAGCFLPAIHRTGAHVGGLGRHVGGNLGKLGSHG